MERRFLSGASPSSPLEPKLGSDSRRSMTPRIRRGNRSRRLSAAIHLQMLSGLKVLTIHLGLLRRPFRKIPLRHNR